jgi:hypothetical protein
VNSYDDSACESPDDCCGQCGGSASGDCGDGGTDGGGDDGGGEEGCLYDWTAYGAENCDVAFDLYGITCEQLEAYYGWDCEGCDCANGRVDGDYSDTNLISAAAISTDRDVNEKVHGSRIHSYRKAQVAKVSKVDEIRPITIVNIETGEVSYFGNEANRTVSYTLNVSCDACLAGGPYEGAFVAAESEMLIYGFDAGSNACGNVVAASALASVEPSSVDVATTLPHALEPASKP